MLAGCLLAGTSDVLDAHYPVFMHHYAECELLI